MNKTRCLQENCSKSKNLLTTFWIKFYIGCNCYDGYQNKDPLYSLLTVKLKSSQYTNALYTFIDELEKLTMIPITGKWLATKIIRQILNTNREIAPFLYGLHVCDIFERKTPKILQITKSNLNLIKKEDIAVILTNLLTVEHPRASSYWAEEFSKLYVNT